MPRRFDHHEVPEMRRKTHSQACAWRKTISTQTRMPRARLAAGKTATDSNEIPQGPTELVVEPCSNFAVASCKSQFNSGQNASNRGLWNQWVNIAESEVFKLRQPSNLFPKPSIGSSTLPGPLSLCQYHKGLCVTATTGVVCGAITAVKLQ